MNCGISAIFALRGTPIRIRATIREIARKSCQEESRLQAVGIIDCALGYNAVGTSERVVSYGSPL